MPNLIRTTPWLAMLSLALALIMPLDASAASIRGVLKNDQGQPIRNAEVCLLSAASATTWQCIQSRHSASKGKYAFASLKKGVYYVVVRRIDTMGPSYAWLPSVRKVDIPKQTSVVKAVDFGWINQEKSGGFKYNNFKNDRPLKAADFPELAQFNTANETVALKLFIPAAGPTQGEQVLFLGTIKNAESLSITPSLPNTAHTLNYEIFSPSHTVNGSLSIQ